MSKRQFQLLLAVAISLAARRGAAELPFTHFTPDGGAVRLPSASVQKMQQDRAGHIWLAFFSSGLARYDGHSIETYGVEDGLANLTIREILVDPSGHLWVGNPSRLQVSDGPVDDSKPRRIRFVTRVGDVTIPAGQVRRNTLVVDPDGWVSSSEPGQIRQFRITSEGRLVTRSIPLDGRTAAVLTIAPDGSLYGAGDGRFFRVKRGTTHVEIWRDDAYGARETAAIFVTRRGDLIAGSLTGEVWRRSRDATQFAPLPTSAAERITGFAETRDGRLWATSLGSGLMSISLHDPPAVQQFSRRDGLLGATLWSILVDREGNLWIGQNGGVSRLRYDFEAFENLTAISHAGERPVLPDPGCFGAVPPAALPVTKGDPASWLWIATGGGMSIAGPDRVMRELQVEDGLRSNASYGVSRDERGTIWIATANGLNAVVFGAVPAWSGITDSRPVRLFEHDAVVVSFAPHQITYRTRSIHFPGGETAMCAGSVAGLSCLVDDRWIVFGRAAGLTYVYDFDFDDTGRLWAARYDGGVFRSREALTLEAMRRLAAASTSHDTGWGREVNQRVFDHVEGGGESARAVVFWNGSMWAGVAEGVAVFSEGKRTALLQSEALGGDAANAIAPSPRGTIWFAHNLGLTELDGNLRVLRQVTARDGLVADESWGSAALSFGVDGRLYFSTARGLSIVRPEALQKNLLPPPMRVEQFTLQENGAQNEISIHYAALSFANEDKVRYRTRLAGYERDWTPPVTTTSLRYTNLPAWFVPRRYVFEVRAANNDGVWSKPLRFAFTIHPPWWRTWWALGALVLLLALSGALFLRHRTRQLQARNRELVQTVASRTHELRARAHELAMLDGIVEAMNRETSLDQLLHALLLQGATLLPQAEKGVMLILDHEQNEAIVEATLGYELNQFVGLDLSIDDAVRRYSDPANIVADGIFLIHRDEYAGLYAREKIEEHLSVPIKSMLTIRVGVGERVEGFLVFDSLTDEKAFDHVDVGMLTRFRQHALSAIGKARMLREVRSANLAKSAFLSKMSHEIRTPLNAILGFVQLMLRSEGRSDKDRSSLSIVMRSGEHLLGLINDVLSMAKIEAGQMALNESAFDATQLVRAIVETISARATSMGVAVRHEVQGFPSSVRGDSVKLRQVLLNLLDNAIKFSGGGDVSLLATWELGRAAFRIEDRGAGMSPAEVARLFQPFVQTSSGAASQEGTGLGLAICHTFVRMMGGSISVDSEPGRGSRFSFDIALPAAEAVETVERRRVVGLAPGQPRYRFLIADDREENRLLLQELLSSLGFEVACATDGQEAIDAWKEQRPDLVWMDILMPVVDGYAATRAIRAAEGEGRRTVIIAVTASAFEHDRERILASGCDDFVAKPFLQETICEAISRHLSVRWTYEKVTPAVAPQLSMRRVPIPEALRARMSDALTRGDVVAAHQVNEELHDCDSAMAARIRELIKGYRFDDVQALMDGVD